MSGQHQQGMAETTIRGFVFSDRTEFALHGVVTFSNCLWHNKYNIINMYKHKLEPGIEINKTMLHEGHNQSFPVIKIKQCTFYGLHVHWMDFCMRKLEISETTWISVDYNSGLHLHMHFASVYYLLLRDTVSDLIEVHFMKKDQSLGVVHLDNVTVNHTNIDFSRGERSLAGFYITHCNFLDIKYGYFLILPKNTFQVSVINSHFTLSDNHYLHCYEGCMLRVIGSYIDSKTYYRYSFLFSLLQWKPLLMDYHRPMVNIQNSRFVGSTARASGGVILCHMATLFLSNNSFIMTRSSTPPALGGFIYFTGDAFNSTGNMMDVRALNGIGKISVLFFEGTNMNILQTKVLCPTSMNIGHDPANDGKIHEFLCRSQCDENSYSFQNRIMIIEKLEYIRNDNFSFSMELSLHKKDLTCFPCPSGALCNASIKALPNYWGFRNSLGSVSMIKCPDLYCCQSEYTCNGIDSCNFGRTGTLCGSCIDSFDEGLLSSACISNDECYHLGEVIALHVGAACLYAIVLLVARVVKNTAIQIFHKIISCFRQKDKTRSNQLSSSNDTHRAFFEEIQTDSSELNQSSAPFSDELSATMTERSAASVKRRNAISLSVPEDYLQKAGKSIAFFLPETVKDATYAKDEVKTSIKNSKDAGGMKYLQILFFYIQDASLFKLSMPQKDNLGTNPFEAICQFSPELLSLYSSFTTLCVDISSPAATKTLLRSTFGFTVMSILLFLYLLLSAFFAVSTVKSHYWETLKVCLIESFIMALLFSYQNLISGAFTLVNCVSIENNEVLKMDGHTHCYQWWQIGIKLYILLGILPALVTISTLPFKVQNRSMSVASFFLYSLFPLPMLLQQCLNRLLSNKRAKESQMSDSMLHAQEENTPTEEAVLHSLLHHYVPFQMCGTKFTWLGMHKLFRIFLVGCQTYISEPIIRLLLMNVALILITSATIYVKPYVDKKANFTAIFSYCASLVIVSINIGKAFMITFDSKRNLPLKVGILRYFDKIEDTLLLYVPVAAVVLWLLCTGIVKCKSRKKQVTDLDDDEN